jgi:hypothetical protein
MYRVHFWKYVKILKKSHSGDKWLSLNHLGFKLNHLSPLCAFLKNFTYFQKCTRYTYTNINQQYETIVVTKIGNIQQNFHVIPYNIHYAYNL